jgi:hypothetical protein
LPVTDMRLGVGLDHHDDAHDNGGGHHHDE